MCERYAQGYTWKEVHAFLDLAGAPQNLKPRYNVAATQDACIVRIDGGRRVLDKVRWGLIPFWARHERFATRLINAGAETVASMPAFRTAFRARRCLVPVSGFYKWAGPPKQREPYYVVMREQRLYALAGLWESWRPKDRPDAEAVKTFTIITIDAQGIVRELDTRMPVIVAAADFDAWFATETSTDELQAILARANGEGLRYHPVSSRVNSVLNDDASPIDEVAL